MAVFLFTIVNTKYCVEMLIYPDFASGFAANYPFSRQYLHQLRPGLPETKV